MLTFKLTGNEVSHCMWAVVQTLDSLSPQATAEITAAYLKASLCFPKQQIEPGDLTEYEITLELCNFRGFLTPIAAGTKLAPTARDRNVYRRIVKRLRPLFIEHHDLICEDCRGNLH